MAGSRRTGLMPEKPGTGWPACRRRCDTLAGISLAFIFMRPAIALALVPHLAVRANTLIDGAPGTAGTSAAAA